MKKNNVNKIKTLTLVTCILMTLTTFSSAAPSFPGADETIENEDEIATSMLVYEVEFPSNHHFTFFLLKFNIFN